MSGQVSRGSAGEYQADERAGVAGLRSRVSDRKSVVYDSTSGEGAADWFREFDAQLEEVFSEVETEES